MAEEKNSGLTFIEFAKKLNKEYKNENLLRRSDIVPQYKRLRSGALGLDYVLYGGLPYGRISQASGMFHSGKTIMSCAFLAAYQKENPDKTCVFVDAEHSLDLQFQILMNGLDQEKLFIFTPMSGMSGEQILGAVLEMQTKVDDIGMIIVDSVPALVTSANLDGDFEDDKGMRATIAKYLHKFCPEILASVQEKNNIVHFINQSRIIGYSRGMGGAQIPVYSEYGGSALGFYTSVSVRCGTRKFTKDGEILSGNKGEGADGFRIVFNVTKNKTCAVNRGGGFITYSYEKGMDRVGDALEIAFNFDYVKSLSSKTYALVNPLTGEMLTDEYGKTITGYRKNIKTYLLEHPDFCNQYISWLNEAISASNTVSNLLSKEDLDTISEEENACEASEK